MKKKVFIFSEIIGAFVTTAGVIFLWHLYELTNKSTLGIVFGAVNSSVWEKCKGISICFLLYGIVELLCVKPRFYSFVSAKTFGLSVSITVFLIADSLFGVGLYSDVTILTVSALCGFTISALLTLSRFNLRPFFAPACFLLLLIFMMTFSFTAFAPRLPLFKDPFTGYYGVIPQSFDYAPFSLG